MRKDRHILSKDWKYPPGAVVQITKELQIEPHRLRILGIHEDWKGIETRIYEAFCKPEDPARKSAFFWDDPKYDIHTIEVENPFNHLEQLVDRDENVWFITTEGNPKLWFSEGFIKEIVQVISEMNNTIKEMYIVSKTFEWMICISEYNQLMLTAPVLPEKFRQLIKSH